MAVLDPNEIFTTAFEPKQTNRFIILDFNILPTGAEFPV